MYKEVDMSDSLVLVDFAVGLVDFILHLPDRQLKVLDEFFWKINLIYRTCESFVRLAKNYFWASTSWLQD